MSGEPTPLTWPPLREVARIEGRRLLTHPIVIAGFGFLVLGAVIFVRTARSESIITWNDDAWKVGAGGIFLALFTMIAANYATLRDRKDDTGEQTISLPVGFPTRTAGVIMGTLWPAAVAGIVVGLVAAYGATRTDLTGADRVQVVAFAVIVVMLGTLGAALGTWLPNPYIAPVAAWGLVLLLPKEDASAWHVLAPITDVQDTAMAMWHIGYQIGLTILFATIAVGRTRRSRMVVLSGVVGLAIVLTSAIVMIPRVCPSRGVCSI